MNISETTPLQRQGMPNNDAPNFSLEQVAPDIYLCRELHYTRKYNVANLWVVRGHAMDLIVDTGLGLWDYKQFLLDNGLISSSKPYQAVVTHVHFDHAGGLYQFKESCAIHVDERAALEKGDNVTCCTFMTQGDCGKNPPTPDWKASQYRVTPVRPTRMLKGSQDVFDLGGGRLIQVLHTPGHSRGSICLWDKRNGFLFTGDTIETGEVLDFAPTSSIQDYLQTMELLSRLAPQVTRVFPGHGPEKDRRRMKEIADQYIRSVGVCHTCMSGTAKVVLTALLRGRNTKEAKLERCCYYGCCFCFIAGPAMDFKDGDIVPSL